MKRREKHTHIFVGFDILYYLCRRNWFAAASCRLGVMVRSD